MTAMVAAGIAEVGAATPAALVALRGRGAAQLDPVRWHFIEALARRAATHVGEARHLLDARLAAELAAVGRRLDAVRPGTEVSSPPAMPDAASDRGGPLAELVRDIQRRAAQARGTRADEGPAAGAGAPRELQAMGFFRSTWSRLRVERQLTQSQAQVPENAGPLHSDRLVLRALQAMREISPAYLDRYMAYADTLLWLDQARGGHAALPVSGPRADGEKAEKADKKRKPVRGKAGKTRRGRLSQAADAG